MRFRIRSGGPARRFVFERPDFPERSAPPAPVDPPPALPAPPKASDLDNPYTRYYGRPRSREELRKNRT